MDIVTRNPARSSIERDVSGSTTSAFSGASGWSARVVTVLAERRRHQAVFRKTHAELSAMADGDPADIGLRRSMIDDIARDAALSA